MAANKLISALSLSALILSFVACDERMPVAADYIIPPSGEWPRGMEMGLSPVTPDSSALQSGSYDIVVSLRTDPSYPYSDIWIKAEESSLSIAPHSDTIRMRLTESAPGNEVNSRHGVTETQYILRRSVTPGEKYSLSLSHIMELDTLPGVISLGVRIVPDNSRN